jgi:hypothetical protein
MMAYGISRKQERAAGMTSLEPYDLNCLLGPHGKHAQTDVLPLQTVFLGHVGDLPDRL